MMSKLREGIVEERHEFKPTINDVSRSIAEAKIGSRTVEQFWEQ
jgi:hypothetical protein